MTLWAQLAIWALKAAWPLLLNCAISLWQRRHPPGGTKHALLERRKRRVPPRPTFQKKGI